MNAPLSFNFGIFRKRKYLSQFQQIKIFVQKMTVSNSLAIMSSFPAGAEICALGQGGHRGVVSGAGLRGAGVPRD